MRRITFAAFITGLATLFGGLAVAQHQGHHSGHGAQGAAPIHDTRVLVTFPPELAAHTLANMRDHLTALQEINDALGRGQNDLAAKIAEERLGMSSLRLHGAHEVSKFMPQGMQDAGTEMHRSASRFALAAQTAGVTGDLKPALSALGDVVKNCVGCHAGYKLK